MSQGNDQMNDSAFDKYLEGDSALSQAYAELPQIEAPDHLNAVILAEAHRAVGAAPGGRKKHHWNFPLSMVATLFVVVMAGLILPDMLKDASITHELQQSKPAASVEVVAMAPAPAAAGKAMPAKAMAESVRAAPEPMLRKADVMSVQSAADKPAEAAPIVAQPPAAPAPAPSVSGAAVGRMQAQEQMEREERKTASREKRAVMAVESRKLEAAPAAAMVAPSAMMDEAAPENPQAEEWLQRIKKLKQEGKLEDVKKELAEFRKIYPAYAIPKELSLQ